MRLLHVVTNSMEQMRLTQPYIAVDKQRIVGSCRMARHRHAGSVRKLIARTHHKRLEGKPRVACLTRTGRWPYDPVGR